jgi:hypothetical protein
MKSQRCSTRPPDDLARIDVQDLSPPRHTVQYDGLNASSVVLAVPPELQSRSIVTTVPGCAPRSPSRRRECRAAPPSLAVSRRDRHAQAGQAFGQQAISTPTSSSRAISRYPAGLDEGADGVVRFGQGDHLSPLQMAMVTARIANDGVVMKPYSWTPRSRRGFETLTG